MAKANEKSKETKPVPRESTERTSGVGQAEQKVKFVNPAWTKEVINAGAHTVMLCFQCGTCSASCPSGRHTAFRTRKLVRRVQLGFKEDVLPSDELWLCSTCYTCYERCPRGVEIVDVIMTLRNLAVKEGYMGETHKKVANFLIKSGHMVPLTDEYKSLRKKLGLPGVPATTLADKESLQKFQEIVKAIGFDKLLAK